MSELSVQRIGSLEKYNKDRLKEFMKSIPETDLMDIGIPVKNERGMNIFNSDILRGNIIPYIAIKNNEIWGMSFLWKCSAIYVPSYKKEDSEGNLNLARLDGWELLGCYTDPKRVGNSVLSSITDYIRTDVAANNELLFLVVRPNQDVGRELKIIYEKHITNFSEIYAEKEYDFTAYVDYLMQQKVPAKEILEIINARELYDKRAARLEYYWSRMVKEGKGFCLGNYMMEFSPLFVSNNCSVE